MPFFTSGTKKPAPVFAGLDDPFNFPSSKMRYTSRSSSRTSSPDSGYGSIDDDAQLSPKSKAPAQSKRRLKKDGKGHWRMHSYEYQSMDNDVVAERTPILEQDAVFPTANTVVTGESEGRKADNAHEFIPNPRRTFTLICDEGAQKKTTSKPTSTPPSKPEPKPKEKESWFERRVYGRALQRRERSEGVSELQRQMAPVLRRASPAPERDLVERRAPSTSRRPSASGRSSSAGQKTSAAPRPSGGQRKGSTLLHPSPPPASSRTAISPRRSFGVKTTITGGGEVVERGRTRKPSTLLHPSPPASSSSSSSSSSTAAFPFSFPFPSSTSTSTSTSTSSHTRARARAPTPLPLSHQPKTERTNESLNKAARTDEEALRSPRHRSQTPLRIPLDSAGQPAPTPLRIRIRSGVLPGRKQTQKQKGGWDGKGGKKGGQEGGRRRTSVLHSCFSSDEEEEEEEEEDDDDDDQHDNDRDVELSKNEVEEGCAWSVSSGDDVDGKGEGDRAGAGDRDRDVDGDLDVDGESDTESALTTGVHNEVILARTGMVARAQRVRVGGARE